MGDQKLREFIQLVPAVIVWVWRLTAAADAAWPARRRWRWRRAAGDPTSWAWGRGPGSCARTWSCCCGTPRCPWNKKKIRIWNKYLSKRHYLKQGCGSGYGLPDPNSIQWFVKIGRDRGFFLAGQIRSSQPGSATLTQSKSHYWHQLLFLDILT